VRFTRTVQEELGKFHKHHHDIVSSAQQLSNQFKHI